MGITSSSQRGNGPDGVDEPADPEQPQPQPPSPQAAAAASNFGWGAFFGGAQANDAHAPLVARRVAHIAGPPSTFPTVPRETTLNSLIAEGLRPDVAFVPFQMARGEVRGEEERAERERPTIRCKNPFHIVKSSIAFTPTRVSPPTAAVSAPRSSGSGPALPPKPASASTSYRLSFQFESLCPTRVGVHLLANEVPHDKLVPAHQNRSRFQQNSAVGSAVPILPAQTFPAGKHTYQMPPDAALDIHGLSDLQLTHSHRLHYYPLILHMEEVEEKDSIESSHSSQSNHQSQTPPRVTSFTTYCSLSKSNSCLHAKVVRSCVRVMPQGKVFTVEEIYGVRGDTEGDEDDEAKDDGSTTAATIASTSSSGATSTAECVVCMSEARDTVIFPCRHMCVCNECAKVLKNQTPARCPVCRFTIEGCVRIVDPISER